MASGLVAPKYAPTDEQVVSGYGHYVALVAKNEYEDDAWTMAWLSLSWRTELAERWERLTDDQKARVCKADDLLVEQWRHIAAMIETLAEDEPDRKLWWWHLDEGPQVREEAEKLKAAS